MDEATQQLVRDWLTRASHDLRAATTLSSSVDPLLDVAIYHCQQAAEKAMKGWLQSQDAPFPKTHDVADLVSQAALLNADFNGFLVSAAVLTPYVSAFRYPGGWDEPMPTAAEFDEALGLAQDIYDFVLKTLPPEVQP